MYANLDRSDVRALVMSNLVLVCSKREGDDLKTDWYAIRVLADRIIKEAAL